jgi:hypothetical protein
MQSHPATWVGSRALMGVDWTKGARPPSQPPVRMRSYRCPAPIVGRRRGQPDGPRGTAAKEQDVRQRPKRDPRNDAWRMVWKPPGMALRPLPRSALGSSVGRRRSPRHPPGRADSRFRKGRAERRRRRSRSRRNSLRTRPQSLAGRHSSREPESIRCVFARRCRSPKVATDWASDKAMAWVYSTSIICRPDSAAVERARANRVQGRLASEEIAGARTSNRPTLRTCVWSRSMWRAAKNRDPTLSRRNRPLLGAAVHTARRPRAIVPR